MTDCITHIRNLLQRDGTNQFERLLDALRPDFIRIDERSREDLYEFFKAFSKEVQYYNFNNLPDGEWQSFFNDLTRTYEPHIALMMTFIEILKTARDHINEITLKHLEFYYKKVLQIKEKDAVPDKLHLLFELAKHTDQCKLEKGTLVKGKNEKGDEVLYETEREIVLNKGTVGSLKTVFIDRSHDHRIYAAPVANSSDGLGKEFDIPEPKWHTFGKSQLGVKPENRTMLTADAGLAIAAPILFLSEGERIITLTLELTAPEIPGELSGKKVTQAMFPVPDYFDIFLSSAESWIRPATVEVKTNKEHSVMEFIMTIEPGQPAITSCSKEKMEETFKTSYPLLKIILQKEPKDSAYHYLKDLIIQSVSLNVKVNNVRNLILQNETGVLDPSKPFQPFGSSPSTGSILYVGNSEIFNKKPDSLTIRYKWKDLPLSSGSFYSYYQTYNTYYFNAGQPDKTKSDSIYSFLLSSLNDKQWYPEESEVKNKLFNYTSGNLSYIPLQSVQVSADVSAKSKKIRKEKESFAGDLSSAPLDILQSKQTFYLLITSLQNGEVTHFFTDMSGFQFRHRESFEDISRYDSLVSNGFIKLELHGGDFGHKDYGVVTMDYAMNKDKYSGPPNVPYTPVMEYLEIDYTSSLKLDKDTAGEYKDLVQLFHIEPFGTKVCQTETISASLSLLPPCKVKEGETLKEIEGCLYIGLRDLVPPQNISLLFQVAEGSSEGDTLPDPGEIHWSFLSQDEWIPVLSQDVIADSTNGFLKNGIITFNIPGTATSENHIMPSGYHWLRGHVFDNALGVNQMIDIRAQAVTAVLKKTGNSSRLQPSVLPSGSVTKLSVNNPSVKKIEQPFASFGGKMAESAEAFSVLYYTRVSERLRHKNRIVTVWDLERMVLQNFPNVYKVKGIQHCSDLNDISPGNITLVVIENIRNKNAVNPLQPRTSQNTLSEIREFINNYISPFVTVNVQNPIYEIIEVDFKVAFRKGYDPGYYKIQLNEDIKRFLSPWAYEEGADIIFGTTVYKSSILYFVEQRDYVDYVVDFRMYHRKPGWGISCMEIEDDFIVGADVSRSDVDEIHCKTNRSILVSHELHSIDVIGTEGYKCTDSVMV